MPHIKIGLRHFAGRAYPVVAFQVLYDSSAPEQAKAMLQEQLFGKEGYDTPKVGSGGTYYVSLWVFANLEEIKSLLEDNGYTLVVNPSSFVNGEGSYYSFEITYRSEETVAATMPSVHAALDQRPELDADARVECIFAIGRERGAVVSADVLITEAFSRRQEQAEAAAESSPLTP